MKKENIFVLNNGDILNVNTRKAFVEKDQVEADAILVDGLGVGDVGNIVLRDRKLLSESGLMIVVAAIERKSSGGLRTGHYLERLCLCQRKRKADGLRRVRWRFRR